MDFNEYQKEAKDSSWHQHGARTTHSIEEVAFHSIALCGEVGEVANLVKKMMRGDVDFSDYNERLKIADEMGDALWYMGRLADEIGVSLSQIAEMNLRKIRNRKANVDFPMERILE